MHPIKNQDILFILNPHSGKKQVNKIVETINSEYSGISAVVTNNLEELEKLFVTKIDKYKVFIVVGGDGTVNEATKYLENRNDKILGIYPLGSGNGFARELGFKKSLQSLIEDAKKGEFVKVDLISINEENCINAAGLGFDSFVAHDFQTRNNRGLKSYILSVLKSILKFKPFNATIHFGKERIQDKFLMITIANTRQFGNNALIAPQAKPNDGKMDLVLVKPFPVYIYPVFIIRMFLGKLKESKYISSIPLEEDIEIKSAFKKYHIDGDPKIFIDNLSVKMLENKVHVLRTKHCKS